MTDKEIKEVFDFYKKAGQKSLIYESISDQLIHVDSNEFSKIAFIDNWVKENNTQVEEFNKKIKDKFVEEYKNRVLHKTFVKVDKNRLGETTIQIVYVNGIGDVTYDKDMFHKYKFAPLYRTSGCYLKIELFIVDTLVDGMVDKIDNNLLKEQIDFFAEIRHAYHEFNMVEEAIYRLHKVIPHLKCQDKLRRYMKF